SITAVKPVYDTSAFTTGFYQYNNCITVLPLKSNDTLVYVLALILAQTKSINLLFEVLNQFFLFNRNVIILDIEGNLSSDAFRVSF
ncbi:12862_t:CDS:2, partial [Entrophospora sp. SA101]